MSADRIVMEVKGDGMTGQDQGRNEECFLHRFLKYNRICVQCHDNPDADALASGFALYRYFSEKGVDVRFIYGGPNTISKPNLVMMIEELGIPVEHETESVEADLLITTDCQYGEGNVQRFEAPEVAMIDHHQCGVIQDENCYIRSNLASCSTIVWELLRREGIDANDDIRLATALYYGLYSDSSQFEELFHPMDRDMRDALKKDDAMMFRLINTNLSIGELSVASRALNGQNFSADGHFSVIETENCDPNILGIISDFVIQVEEIDTCVAYNPNPGGYKLSVRSCVAVAKANELAAFLCRGVGNGGGHLNKAGGFISGELFAKEHPGESIGDYLMRRMDEYNKAYEVIYASTYDIDTSDMTRYEKKPVTVGYAKATWLMKQGTPILVRTLEGDVDLIVEDDLYLMIGVEGEVYPIREEKFNKSYQLTEAEPEIEAEYAPTVRDNIYGDVYELTDYMKPALATGGTRILAKKLERGVKVFTAWDPDKYYLGEPGDYIVVREDDAHDIYVVRGNIFDKTYAAC
ncbi:MAG: DHH family phosphoesterase [Eubacterium sp.]|nr:DHH family phosphoesterase [Eubacterium sp.]